MSQEIRYFGADVVFGEDCQPLSPGHGLMVFEPSVGFSESLTVAQLVDSAADLRPPVNYIVLPF